MFPAVLVFLTAFTTAEKKVKFRSEMHSSCCAGCCNLNRHTMLAEPSWAAVETLHNPARERTAVSPLALPHQLN